MSLDLNHVAHFIAVADAGTFTEAARRLRLPKSTLSRAVSQLEAALGVRLMERTTRQVKLTTIGQQYYDRCKPMVAALTDASCTAVEANETVTGTLRFTAPVEFTQTYLGPLISQFRTLHPQLNIEAHLTPDHVDMIDEGLDLAFRVGDLADSSLIARKVCAPKRGLYASPTYLQKHGTPKSLDELSHHQCLTMTLPHGNQWTFTTPNNIQTVDVSGPISSNNVSFLRDMVIAGQGLALLPAFLCEYGVERGQLVHVLCDYRPRSLDVFALYPSNKYLPARVTRFLDFVLRHIKQD